MPDDDRFIHDAYVSGACVGAASTGVWSFKGRPWAGASLNLLLEGYSGKEIQPTPRYPKFTSAAFGRPCVMRAAHA